jgi:hypothetical protein
MANRNSEPEQPDDEGFRPIRLTADSTALTGLDLNMGDRGTISPSVPDSKGPPVDSSFEDSEVESSYLCRICLEPLSNRATVQPCGHAFDLGCIRRWIAMIRPGIKTCPLDRTPIRELKYGSST